MGVPIDRYLHTEDVDERELLRAVKEESLKVLETVIRNIAREIVAEYGSAKERGESKGK